MCILDSLKLKMATLKFACVGWVDWWTKAYLIQPPCEHRGRMTQWGSTAGSLVLHAVTHPPQSYSPLDQSQHWTRQYWVWATQHEAGTALLQQTKTPRQDQSECAMRHEAAPNFLDHKQLSEHPTATTYKRFPKN